MVVTLSSLRIFVSMMCVCLCVCVCVHACKCVYVCVWSEGVPVHNCLCVLLPGA